MNELADLAHILCDCQLPWLVKFVEASWQAFASSEQQYDAKRQHCTEHAEHDKSKIVIAIRIVALHTVDNWQLNEGEQPS